MNHHAGKLCAALIAAGFLLFAAPARSDVTFDFDTGTPALFTGEGIPLDQTSGVITGHVSSPQGNVFSIQTQSSTFTSLSQFSGYFLWPSNINRNSLDISFSQQLTRVTLKFATVDYQDNAEVPANLQLTAYEGSTGNTPVGTASAHGAYLGDTYPMGTLTYDSGGQPFDVIRLVVPFQPQGTTGFMVDNITVTPQAPPSIPTLSTSGAALLFLLLAAGGTLALRGRG